MRMEICVPDFGSPTPEPIRLGLWYAQEGDLLAEGDRLAELVLPGAAVDLDAPADGVLLERLVGPQELLHVGQKIAIMQTFD
jgi:pyruvate/2-oxoglutarate dehydrogenase complex dihydrolipoamide acyltransferase (E2) component